MQDSFRRDSEAGRGDRVAVAAADPVIAITCVMSLSSDLIPSSAGAGADNLGSGLEADGDELGSQGEETIAVEPVALPHAHEQSGSKVGPTA